jgi:hypothetical protein
VSGTVRLGEGVTRDTQDVPALIEEPGPDGRRAEIDGEDAH